MGVASFPPRHLPNYTRHLLVPPTFSSSRVNARACVHRDFLRLIVPSTQGFPVGRNIASPMAKTLPNALPMQGLRFALVLGAISYFFFSLHSCAEREEKTGERGVLIDSNVYIIFFSTPPPSSSFSFSPSRLVCRESSLAAASPARDQ